MSPTEMAQGTPSERAEMAQEIPSVRVAWSSKERAEWTPSERAAWLSKEMAAWNSNATAPDPLPDWELGDRDRARPSQVGSSVYRFTSR